MTDTDAGWVVLIVSSLAWAVKWLVEYKERKKINEEQWRDARVRMGLPQEYKRNMRMS